MCMLVSTIFLLEGCGRVSEDSSGSGADSALYIPRDDLITSNGLRSTTGKTWIVRQTPMLDSSMVSVRVEAIGFSGDTLLFDFGQLDPVIALHAEDLDRDGFQELYIATQSLGAEAYGTLYGLYSMGDDSLTMISYEGATPYTMKEGEPYEGYRGHDSFHFENGKLTNTISVYKPEDTDETPTGGTRTIEYELVNGPVAIRLWPRRPK